MATYLLTTYPHRAHEDSWGRNEWLPTNLMSEGGGGGTPRLVSIHLGESEPKISVDMMDNLVRMQI